MGNWISASALKKAIGTLKSLDLISEDVSGKKYYVKLRGIKRVNKVNYYTPYGNYTEIMVK